MLTGLVVLKVMFTNCVNALSVALRDVVTRIFFNALYRDHCTERGTKLFSHTGSDLVAWVELKLALAPKTDNVPKKATPGHRPSSYVLARRTPLECEFDISFANVPSSYNWHLLRNFLIGDALLGVLLTRRMKPERF